MLGYGDARSAPQGMSAFNPAFDVTPNRYVTAIVTELGVARPPYRRSLATLMDQNYQTPSPSGRGLG